MTRPDVERAGSGSRMMVAARRGTAFGALVVLLLGVPIVLAATIGSPLPGWTDLVAGDASDTAVIALLASIAWMAWAQFLLAVAAEVISVLFKGRSHYQGAVRIPGLLSAQQQLARLLVGAVIVVIPAMNPLTGAVTQSYNGPPAAGGVATAPTATDLMSSGQTVSTEKGAPAVETIVHTVRAGGAGTLWDLAQTYLGDGQRWQEIWHLNEGRRQADGATMTSPGLLRPGWTVLLPATESAQVADGQVVVRSGDTLSALAAEHGTTWQHLWDDNSGRREPGGRFIDPDHIEPGWKITVQDDEERQSRSQDLQGSALEDATPLAAHPPIKDEEASKRAPAHRLDEQRATLSSATTSSRPVPTSARPAPSLDTVVPTRTPMQGERSESAAESIRSRPALEILSLGGGAGLLAGAALLALQRFRRRQFRYRRLGRTIAATPPDLAAMEKTLLAQGGSATADVGWLDDSLRELAADLAGQGQRLPDVAAVRLTPTFVELVLAVPSTNGLPAPWLLDKDSGRWRLAREHRPMSSSDARRRFAPYPTLVSIGYGDGGDYWLLDLERAGAVVVVGERETGLDLARFMAAELAFNVWSEQLHVTLAGFGDELSPINPDRLTYTDAPGSAVSRLAAQAQLNIEVLSNNNLQDALEGRARDIAADQWMPQVLLIHPATTETNELADFVEKIGLEAERRSVAVVMVDPLQAGDSVATTRQLIVTSDGFLSVPHLGLRMRAQQLPEKEAGQLARLLSATTRTEGEAVPASRGNRSWDALADSAGAPLISEVDSVATRDNSVARTGTWPAPITSDAAAARFRLQPSTSRTASTDPDLATLAPAVPDLVRRQVEDADADLDADLSAWHLENTTRPRLSVLGPLLVRAAGSLPSDRPRVGWNTEVVAYLAAHPRGVTAEMFGTDLWPQDPGITSKSKLRQAIYLVRRWLGKDPETGRPYLPAASASPSGGPALYQIDGLLTDADLFRRLRLRGVARGQDGVPDLEAALALVTGPPFDQRRTGGYTWLVDTPLDHEYAGMIVDVAHLVATHHLTGDRPDRAAAAAQVSLLAQSHEDVALLDLVAAADAQGNDGEAAAWIRRILSNHDAEVEEDLPPRTAEILHRRRWIDQAS